MDLGLFPANEEWGTGDEATDNKLSVALKKTTTNLTFESISEFYFLGLGLKLRVYNPSFLVTIELVTKALLHLREPLDCVDHSLKKLKGCYYAKEKSHFHFEDLGGVLSELKAVKKFRYKNQIDFSLHIQDTSERNPYVCEELKRSSLDLNLKIIFKDFKSYLNEELKNDFFKEPFFQMLRGGKRVLLIEKFAEIWYHQDQIYCISKIKEI